MRIQVLVDNPGSWVIPYAKQLVSRLVKVGHEANLISSHEEIKHGDALVLLGCEKILRKMDLNRHNLVVHESYLPKGKGWSPVTWQVLEGKQEIPVTLIEASDKVDAGRIYLQDSFKLNGDELIEEIRELQGKVSIELVIRFVAEYPRNPSVEQAGEGSVYKRRTPADSQLDVNKSIAEQFELLRVVDNERYPAFFFHRGRKYILKVYAEKGGDDEVRE